MAAVDECFKAIHGWDAIMAEQNQRFHTLCSNIRTRGTITGPFRSIDMLSILEETNVVAIQSGAKEAFAVPKKPVMDFRKTPPREQ